MGEDVILTCQCSGMPEFAEQAYKILYPESKTPKIYAGQMRIVDFSDTLPAGEFKDYILSISKNREKFAYCCKKYNNNDEREIINLKTGHKLC